MPRTTFMYGITDDKYVRSSRELQQKISEINSFKYIPSHILQIQVNIDVNKESIVFRTSPETLLNLASSVVNALPLPSVYTWTIEDICRWLRNYGYPQYQHTFRENLVNGHTLLLVDAGALSAMNIKNFDHIRHIAHGIRGLYFFEMAKFGRSISLAPENHYELYKKFRVKTGRYYDTTKRTDLWRSMQLLREPRKYYDHWGELEQHLSMQRYPKYPELFGGSRRRELYKCKQPPMETNVHLPLPCKCAGLCVCNWNDDSNRSHTRLSGSTYLKKPYEQKSRLELLEKLYPHKYGVFLYEVHEFSMESQIIRFKPNKTPPSEFSFS